MCWCCALRGPSLCTRTSLTAFSRCPPPSGAALKTRGLSGRISFCNRATSHCCIKMIGNDFNFNWRGRYSWRCHEDGDSILEFFSLLQQHEGTQLDYWSLWRTLTSRWFVLHCKMMTCGVLSLCLWLVIYIFCTAPAPTFISSTTVVRMSYGNLPSHG